jgi:hypothetical protein
MYTRAFAVRMLAAALLTCGVGSHVRAQALRSDPVTGDADALAGGTVLRITNAGKTAVTITAITVDSVRSASGPVDLEIAAGVPRPLTLQPGSAGTLPLRGEAGWLKQARGRYGARLTLVTGQGVIRIPLSFTLGALPAVRPLAAEVKVAPRGWLPWGTFGTVVQVPVQAAVRPPAREIAALAAPGATPAVVHVESVVPWRERPAIRAYGVRIEGLRGGYGYSGVVPLAPGDDAARVTLKVDAGDAIGWMLLVVGAGVGVGILFRRWRDVEQPVSYLRERDSRLGERVAAALRECRSAGGPADGLEAEFKARRIGLERHLAGLRGVLTREASLRAGFEPAQAELVKLEGFVEEIRRLAAAEQRLNETAAAAEQLAGAVQPAGGDGFLPPRPRVIAAASAAVAGEGVRLDSLAASRDALASLDGFLHRWAGTFQELRDVQNWLERLRSAVPGAARQFDATAAALQKAEWDLWDVADEAELTARMIGTTLDLAEETLRQLAAQLPQPAAAERAPIGAEQVAAAPREGWMARARSAPPATLPAAQQTAFAEYVRRRRALNDVAAAVASFAAALVLMLVDRYLDHPFGTLADYTQAFAWGVAATAGLDLLTSGLTSLRPVITRSAPS